MVDGPNHPHCRDDSKPAVVEKVPGKIDQYGKCEMDAECKDFHGLNVSCAA
jgi:hypothetical protein